jgi:hypothetical protein
MKTSDIKESRPGACVSFAEVLDPFKPKDFAYFWNGVCDRKAKKETCTKKQLLQLMCDKKLSIVNIINAYSDNDKGTLKLERGLMKALTALPRTARPIRLPDPDKPARAYLEQAAKTKSGRRTRRQSRLQTIKMLVDDNPKRRESKSWYRFALYQEGDTVDRAIERGLTAGDIKYDVAHGYIELSQ